MRTYHLGNGFDFTQKFGVVAYPLYNDALPHF
jgi:hypothetical protein